MNFKHAFAIGVSALSLAASAEWKPGEGIANDHARGGNVRDVTFVQRGGGERYGYRAMTTPIGLTFLPWALPNFESSVAGLRLNLGWGRYETTCGLDVGTFSHAIEFGGIAANLCGNWVEGAAKGLQIGAVNAGGEAYGLQIGFVNCVDTLHGVQIGVINIARNQWAMPLINVAF